MSITLDFGQEAGVGVGCVDGRERLVTRPNGTRANPNRPGTIPCPPISIQMNSEPHSRRRAIVVPEQSTEDAMTIHSARTKCLIKGRPRASLFRRECRLRFRTCTWFQEYSISDPLVRPMPVVEANVLLHDVTHMAQAETRKEVQTLALQRTDPDLCKGVGIGREPRRLDCPNPRSLQQRIKARRRTFTSLQEQYEYLRAGSV